MNHKDGAHLTRLMRYYHGMAVKHTIGTRSLGLKTANTDESVPSTNSVTQKKTGEMCFPILFKFFKNKT